MNVYKIPNELKNADIWGVHSNKVPYQGELKYNKLKKAKATDKNTWSNIEKSIKLVGNTYQEVLKNNDTGMWDIIQDVKIDGLTMAITSPYVAIDLDHVINSKGEILPEAREIINIIDSYTEVSTSGTGIHIYLKNSNPLPVDGMKDAEIPNNNGWHQTEHKKPVIEIYQDKRFMVFTGNVFEKNNLLNERTEALKTIYDMYFKDRNKSQYKRNTNDKNNPKFEKYDGKNTYVKAKAKEIINNISKKDREKTRNKFNKLFSGDISDYESHSQADFALCTIISEHTRDTRVIDCIYILSGLYTDKRKIKWDREDYKKATILKAIDTKNTKYNGLKTNSKGVILHTLENVSLVLNKINYKLGFNVLTNEIEVTNKKYHENIEHLVNEIYSYCRSIEFNIKKIDLESYIYYIAKENRYNPFMEYLINCEKKYNNCVGEVEKLINTLQFEIDYQAKDDTIEIEKLYKTMIKKRLVSIAALNLVDDLKETESKALEGTLILKGKQGLGKTTWLKSLVPQGYFKEGATLNESKDNKMEVYRYVLVELGELETTTHKQATGFLKQELTRTSIEYRPPYAKSSIKFARHTVFSGSVNEDTFLKDSTGNRRFWVIPVKYINLSKEIDINKMWAEIVHLYRSGEQWYLNKDERELLELLNGNYININSIGLAIQNNFDFTSSLDEWIYITINSVYELIRGQVKSNITQNMIGEQLRILGCEKTQRRVIKGENPKKVWKVPPLKKGYWSICPLEIWKETKGEFICINM